MQLRRGGVVDVSHLLDRVQLCIQSVDAVFFIQQQDLPHQFTLVSTCCIASRPAINCLAGDRSARERILLEWRRKREITIRYQLNRRD